MKAQELIEKLQPFADKEIDVIYYQGCDASVEIWTKGGEELIVELKTINED